MGIYGIKPRFQQALAVVERPLVRWRVNPDMLTSSFKARAGPYRIAQGDSEQRRTSRSTSRLVGPRLQQLL